MASERDHAAPTRPRKITQATTTDKHLSSSRSRQYTAKHDATSRSATLNGSVGGASFVIQRCRSTDAGAATPTNSLHRTVEPHCRPMETVNHRRWRHPRYQSAQTQSNAEGAVGEATKTLTPAPHTPGQQMRTTFARSAFHRALRGSRPTGIRAEYPRLPPLEVSIRTLPAPTSAAMRGAPGFTRVTVDVCVCYKEQEKRTAGMFRSSLCGLREDVESLGTLRFPPVDARSGLYDGRGRRRRSPPVLGVRQATLWSAHTLPSFALLCLSPTPRGSKRSGGRGARSLCTSGGGGALTAPPRGAEVSTELARDRALCCAGSAGDLPGGSARERARLRPRRSFEGGHARHRDTKAARWSTVRCRPGPKHRRHPEAR